MKSVEEFLDMVGRFKSLGKGSWMVRCPSHNDGENPNDFSLSVKTLPDKILVHCHAGCPTTAVLKALNLKMSDLFFDSRRKAKSSTLKEPKEIVATYDYHNQEGKVLFQVVRFKPKSFAQRRPDGKGGWIWGLRGIKPVLYHLPRVKEAIDKGETIFLPEGEKDADNLINHLGVVATTSPMGVGKWRDRYTQMLTGAKEVVVIADNDSPGLRYAQAEAASLLAVQVPTKLLEMPAAGIKDISDWISAGLTADQLKEIINGLPPYEPPPVPVDGGAPEKFKRTDLGNAERLVFRHGENLHYCYQRRQWLVWNGKCWQWDQGARITTLVQKTVRTIYNEAANEDDDDERKALANHAKASESNSRIKAMIEQAEPMVAIDIKELDSHSWKLNCLNGTVDLKTGRLLPHSREDLLTMVCPVEYHPDAQSALWETFLAKVSEDKADIVTYLQRCMGYTLTGDNSEQCLFFCWGTGQNGKSTFLNAFREILEPYSLQADTDMFMSAFKVQKQGHSEDVANLYGKRYVAASEIEEGRRLAVTKLKQMTGGERVRASHKYEREIEFEVTYKIWLNGNHKPVITDTSFAIWRRVKLIPFTWRIPQSEQDKQLKYKLRSHYPALLAWAVRGCLGWQQSGLTEPASVTDATEAYRHEEDIIGDFVGDCCIMDMPAQVGKKELWVAYQDWTSDSGVPPVGQRTFNRRVSDRGVLTKRGTAGKRMWLGIRLLEEGEPKQVTEVTSGTEFPIELYTRGINNNSITKPITKVTRVTKDTKVTEEGIKTAELQEMLEDYTGLTLAGIIAVWEKRGKPEVPLGQGVKIGNLETYLEGGLIDMDQLGALSELIKEWKKDPGKTE